MQVTGERTDMVIVDRTYIQVMIERANRGNYRENKQIEVTVESTDSVIVE